MPSPYCSNCVPFLDPEDYDAVNKLLTFSATDTRHNIVIVLNNDEINENTEDFLASLTFEGAVNENIQLQPHQSTVRITDDDGMSKRNAYKRNFICIRIRVVAKSKLVHSPSSCYYWIPENTLFC